MREVIIHVKHDKFNSERPIQLSIELNPVIWPGLKGPLETNISTKDARTVAARIQLLTRRTMVEEEREKALTKKSRKKKNPQGKED